MFTLLLHLAKKGGAMITSSLHVWLVRGCHSLIVSADYNIDGVMVILPLHTAGGGVIVPLDQW